MSKEIIDKEFGELLKQFGICYSGALDVRSPEDFSYNYDKPGNWHRDYLVLVPENKIRFVTWSNHSPTELQFFDDSVLKTCDGDVLLIYNGECKHRTPANITDRWFARILNVISTENL